MTLPFIVKRPLVTEKSTALNGAGKYVFVVASDATKPEIRKAIMAMYKVEPVSVNIINRQSKRKRAGNTRGSQQGHKKAIVTLKEGQKIDIQ